MKPYVGAINRLIVNGKFTVAKQGPDLTLVKMVGKRPVTIKLTAVLSSDTFWVDNPERDDRCMNSFFDFTNTPKRVTRNKDVIRVLVKTLKETGLWEYIDNKDFFVVNTNNKKAKQKIAADLFKTIRHGE